MHSEYQIDFFPADKGNAVCLRYGRPGDYRVMAYAGGSADAGNELVAHIREHFDTTVVNDLICAHPNADHAPGLSVLLEKMDVRELWMHRPWAHATLPGLFSEIARTSRAAHFKEKMAAAYALEKLALERRTRLLEPFQGARIGPFMVLSPHYDWYVHGLMPEFEHPRPATRPMMPGLERLLRQVGVRINDPDMPPLSESWEVETLREEGEASAENESSVVMFGMIADQGILLTGNAGMKALKIAASYAEASHVLIPAHLKVVQIPHQGKRNHLSPSILDRLLGPRLRAPVLPSKVTAYLSVPDDADHHLDKVLVNALIRRGAQVIPVQATGKPMCHAWRAEHSDLWLPTEPLPFSPGT